MNSTKNPLGKLFSTIKARLSVIVMVARRYARFVKQKIYLSKIYVRNDGRVNMPNIEIDIVLGCNLRCNHCTHLSPYRKGFVPTEEIVHSFEAWSKKIYPVELRLLGGEPFLHPDLPTVLLESRRIWSGSKIVVFTNGLLLPQASQDVFDALKKAKIHVVVSDHSDSELTYEKVTAGLGRLKENGITNEIWTSNTHWFVMHRFDEHGTPIPFKSSPRSAWFNCYGKTCPSLANNRLYKCSVLACMVEGVKEGAFSPEIWKNALTHSALTPDADAKAIVTYFRVQEEVPECCICPVEHTIVEPSQIPRKLQVETKAI